ncbi:hypothetical protein JST97_15920 [bacterium]|nr:hypothetical protein [bacterium]
MTFWRPATLQDIAHGAVEQALPGVAMAAMLSGAFGLITMTQGGSWAELARRVCYASGFAFCGVAPVMAVVGGLIGALESRGHRFPIHGSLSSAGPDDLVFRSPELTGPLSLSRYQELCEESFPEQPLAPGHYLLQWNGKKATGSDHLLDGASRQAATLVNKTWQKLIATGLHKRPVADLEGLQWVTQPNGQAGLNWLCQEECNAYHVRFLPDQGLCCLVVSSLEGPTGSK